MTLIIGITGGVGSGKSTFVSYIITKNKINKKIIYNKIFSNKTIKKKLENFIHKEVRKQRSTFIAQHKKNNSKTIFIDIPLLFEKNLDNIFDKIVCIICPKKTRLKRLKSKITKGLFKKIIKNQTTNIERKKRSDYCIYNSSSKKIFYKKIDKILIGLGL